MQCHLADTQANLAVVDRRNFNDGPCGQSMLVMVRFHLQRPEPMGEWRQCHQGGCHADLLLSARPHPHSAGPSVQQCHLASNRERPSRLIGPGAAAPRRRVCTAAEHLPPARAADEARLHDPQLNQNTVPGLLLFTLATSDSLGPMASAIGIIFALCDGH